MEILNLSKNTYEKRQYQRVIDTSFNELGVVTPETVIQPTLPTIEQFFEYYNQLFYNIPETGQTNSHEYLIIQSSQYIGFQQTDEDVQALLEEIDGLRQENLELNQQLATIKQTSVNGTGA
jgi:hypothetical protein